MVKEKKECKHKWKLHAKVMKNKVIVVHKECSICHKKIFAEKIVVTWGEFHGL